MFFAGGPMLNGQSHADVKSCVEKMAAELRDRKLYFLDFAGLMAWPNDFGGHYHPKVSSHEKMAKKLVDEIRTKVRW